MMKKRKIHSLLLLPLSILYGTAVFVRNKLFDWKVLPSEEFNMPVISVGNITVGGTGKTPHVEYLIGLLEKDFNIAVLSRGYKRKTSGFVLATQNSSPDEIGDEPCQLKQKFPQVTVAVDEKRVHGIKTLMKQDEKIDVILLDDAFQHRYVKPGLSILLVDYNRPPKEDFLLPAGRLRESLSARNRAGMILVTKTPETIRAMEMRLLAKEFNPDQFQHLFFTTMRAETLKPVFSDHKSTQIGELLNHRPDILLVSGVASPRQVKRMARKLSPKITELAFPDHHVYNLRDAQKIRTAFQNMAGKKKIMITTEKDTIKLRNFKNEFKDLLEFMYYIPVSVHSLNNDTEQFNAQITNYVRNNKRNSVLHQGKNGVPA